jgi:hypothetical protein
MYLVCPRRPGLSRGFWQRRTFFMYFLCNVNASVVWPKHKSSISASACCHVARACRLAARSATEQLNLLFVAIRVWIPGRPTDFSRFQSVQARRFCCWEYSGLDLRLTPHLHLVPRLGVSGAVPPPLCMPSGYKRTVLPFSNYGIFILHAPRKFDRLKVNFLLITIVTDFMLMIRRYVLAAVCMQSADGLSRTEFDERWHQDNKTYFGMLPSTDFAPPSSLSCQFTSYHPKYQYCYEHRPARGTASCDKNWCSAHTLYL